MSAWPSIGDNLGMDVLLEQQGCGRVAQVVERDKPDTGTGEQRPEGSRQQVRDIHRPADLIREQPDPARPTPYRLHCSARPGADDDGPVDDETPPEGGATSV